MSLQEYTKATVYINGGLLSQETGLTIKRATGAQTVKTVALGLAGPSPGAPMMSVSIKNAVPSADFEVNPGPFMKALSIVEFIFYAAGRTCVTTGWIDSDNFSHAVDTPSALDMEAVCVFADWQ